MAINEKAQAMVTEIDTDTLSFGFDVGNGIVIQSHGSSLRDAITDRIADLVRHLLGYKDPAISLEKMKFDVLIERINQNVEDDDVPSFSVDMRITPPKKGTLWEEPEGLWWDKKYGHRNTIHKLFLVYGDDPNIRNS